METVRELIKPVVPLFVRKGVWKYRHVRDLLRFAARQRKLDFQIGDQPMLDEDASTVFLELFANASSYLEYGSGGSTVLAARSHKPFVSVDTDRFFLKALHKKIGDLAPNQHLLWANIGWTSEFGYPVFEKATENRRKMWRAYIDLPWQYVDRSPDLVMVDGRFRIASALTSCAHLTQSPGSRIVVNDYFTRPEYRVIEDHAKFVGTAGRMAIFEPPSTCSSEIYDAIDRYAVEWR